mmetsp:Transcript_19033/g.27362  ORF Transcript_19033/g.27362 Transcript_19033/m.27362 type:complete len:495 (-) Transcript_19033:798-2282(-)
MIGSGPSLSPAEVMIIEQRDGDRDGDGQEEIVDLKERMQYMIDLQNEYSNSFRMDQSESIITSGVTTSTAATSDTAAVSPPTSTTPSANTHIHNHNHNHNHTHHTDANIHALMPVIQTTTPNINYSSNSNNQPISTNISQTHIDPEVGRGQLYFPPGLSNGLSGTTEATPMINNPQMEFPQNHFDHPHHHRHNETQNQRYSDYVDPYEMTYQDDTECCHKCCCIWKPFSNCLKRLWRTESLHRSLCYGAIDGMLTGAGIVATFCGMGIIDGNTTARNLWVVAFSLAACTSDALCMAVGHVWSTHVLTSQSATERQEERLAFQSNRSDSKGKLVDMLLSRGMLKIDAMSIADTLEGYPDIFISALVGENYVLGDGDAHSGALSKSTSGSRSLTSGQINDYGTYRSYGNFNELEHDPEAAIVVAATSQAQKEATAMMLAFSVFGGVPGIILYVISHLSSNMDADISNTEDTQVMSVTSAAMTIGCIIMLLLGYWKR